MTTKNPMTSADVSCFQAPLRGRRRSACPPQSPPRRRPARPCRPIRTAGGRAPACSSRLPPRRDQAGTCIMVELGNGDRDRFFFDFGPGCVKNILAMGVPVPSINDIFITHLHVDHYHDLSYLLPFSAWAGRWKMPLRVTGPSGRTPELGTKGMVAGMKQMLKWHLEAFDACPIGDGYEIEVNEFDWKDENGICYDKNGVTIRHWRRSHTKDGASAYRLDWNGLSFVWTGDGRPDELTAKYAAGADVFVTECQPDLARLN